LNALADNVTPINGRMPLNKLVVPLPASIRPRPWLFGHWLMRGAVTLIVAPGGTGKTALLTASIMSSATGRELLDGIKPLRPLTVAVLGLEEGEEEMHRRFAAAMIHYGIKTEDYLGRIHYLDGKKYQFLAAWLDQQGQVQESPQMAELEIWLGMLGVDILFADPLALAHSAPENDNNAMARVVSYFSGVAGRVDCAVGLFHHTRKGAQAGDPDGIRGAGALVNHARIAIGLSGMCDDDAKIFNISKDDARRLIRVDDLKLNYSPKAGEARWVKLESVALGNPSPEYPYGDSVQVATPWSPPQAAQAFTPTIANKALDVISLGLPGPKGDDRYSAAPNAKGKAAYKVIVLTMREYGHEIGDAEARQIIKNWLTVQPAVLREESYYSPNERKQVLGLFVNEGNRP
jgi:hypothetical protein